MTSASACRVLISNWFSRTLELEGAGSLLFGLAHALSRRGCTVRLLLPAGHYQAPAGVEVCQYSGRGGGVREYLRALQWHSREVDAVLLFENNPNMAFTAKYAPCDNTLCYFFTPLQPLREAWRNGFSRQSVLHTIAKLEVWSRLQKWRGRRCIVQTAFQAEQLRRLGSTEIHVIPGCGISVSQAVPERCEARRMLGWDELPVVGYLGHYSRAKGVDVLVEAMAGTKRGLLALAHSGKGQLTALSAQRLESLRAAGRVRLVGVTEATTFLAACDVAVFPYVTGSVHHLPQALMESHAAATAVITTDVGGVSDGHRKGETGWLVPPRDVSATRQAIESALEDLGHCHDMGRAAREMFEERWCVEVFAQKVGDLVTAGIPSRAGAGTSDAGR